MKLADILGSQELLARLKSEKMTATLAFRIYRIIKLIEPEIANFTERRNDLIKEYGIQHDENIQVEPGTVGYSRFVQEINDLVQEEVEIGFKKINTLDIPFQMSPEEMALIDWMVEDGES